MVTLDIPLQQHELLTADEATIIEIDFLRAACIRPHQERWRHVMTKLPALQLTQYEKVLVMDLDTVLFHPLDAVFQDPATEPQKTKFIATRRGWPESEPPTQYIFAGVRNLKKNHTFSPSIANRDFQTGKETYVKRRFFRRRTKSATL